MNNDMIFVYVTLGFLTVVTLFFVGVAIVCRENKNTRDKAIASFIVPGVLTLTLLICIILTPKCPNCNVYVVTTYCQTCGTAVREIVPDCPNCGEKCSTPFCGNCGTKVTANQGSETE